MLFFGNPIMPKYPEACDSHHGDCPVHGFGLSLERATLINDALLAHAEACLNDEAKTVDLPRLVAGPADLDLLSPVEVLITGYMLYGYVDAAKDYLRENNPNALLPETIQRIIRTAESEGAQVHITRIDADSLPDAIQQMIAKIAKNRQGEGATDEQPTDGSQVS